MLKKMMIKHHKVRNLYPLVGAIISTVLFMLYWGDGFNKFLSLFLTILGLAIWWIATVTLGKSFSLLPTTHGLVQKGIYSKIRHPIYLGVSITFIGWAIWVRSSLFTLLAAAIILSSIIRASLEEKRLIKAFGIKYMVYKKKTWF